MFWLCWTLVTVAVELYSSYCHSVVVMVSRLSSPSSCNQKKCNLKWTSYCRYTEHNLICVSDQLQLIRFHVVFSKYRITFLAVFQWSISGLIKYLSSFSMVYVMSRWVQTWVYIRLPTADAYVMSFICSSVGRSWDIIVNLTYLF